MAALREADVVDFARARKLRRDACSFCRPDAAGDAIGARKFETDDEITAAERAQRDYKLGDQARASFEIAAVLVVAVVRPWRKKLMKQVAVAGRDFDSAPAAALQTMRRLSEIIDQPADLAGRERVRNRPAQIIGQRACADGVGIASRRVPPPARVLHLREKPAVLGFDRVGPALECVHVIVIPDANSRRNLLMRRHAQRLGDDQRGAALRAVRVILDEAVRHAAVFAHQRAHRRVHEPVAQALAREGEWREQRWIEGIYIHTCTQRRLNQPSLPKLSQSAPSVSSRQRKTLQTVHACRRSAARSSFAAAPSSPATLIPRRFRD